MQSYSLIVLRSFICCKEPWITIIVPRGSHSLLQQPVPPYAQITPKQADNRAKRTDVDLLRSAWDPKLSESVDNTSIPSPYQLPPPEQSAREPLLVCI